MLSGEKKKNGIEVKKGRSAYRPRKAWSTSKIGVDGEVKDYKEKTDILFHEKLSLQVPENVESEETLEIIE